MTTPSIQVSALPSLHYDKPMHTTEFEVLESFSKLYCPICMLSDESARDCLAGVLGDNVNGFLHERYGADGDDLPKGWSGDV